MESSEQKDDHKKVNYSTLVVSVLLIPTIAVLYRLFLYCYEMGYAEYFGFDHNIISLKLMTNFSFFELIFLLIIIVVFTFPVKLMSGRISVFFRKELKDTSICYLIIRNKINDIFDNIHMSYLKEKTRVVFIISSIFYKFLKMLKYCFDHIDDLISILIKYLLLIALVQWKFQQVSINYIFMKNLIFIISLLFIIPISLDVISTFHLNNILLGHLKFFSTEIGNLFINLSLYVVVSILIMFLTGYGDAENKHTFMSIDNGKTFIVRSYEKMTVLTASSNISNSNRIYFYLPTDGITNQYLVPFTITVDKKVK